MQMTELSTSMCKSASPFKNEQNTKMIMKSVRLIKIRPSTSSFILIVATIKIKELVVTNKIKELVGTIKIKELVANIKMKEL